MDETVADVDWLIDAVFCEAVEELACSENDSVVESVRLAEIVPEGVMLSESETLSEKDTVPVNSSVGLTIRVQFG